MSGTITVPKIGIVALLNNRKYVIVENCAPCTNCISEINNTEMDHAKDIDVVIPMYNLIKYRNNYSKTSGILWQYYRD